MGNRCYHHLCNPVAPADDKILLPMVDHYDLDLAPIVGIYGARGIHKAYAVLYGQTGAGADLGLIPDRQLDGKTGWNQIPLTRLKDYILLETSLEVCPCSLRR